MLSLMFQLLILPFIVVVSGGMAVIVVAVTYIMIMNEVEIQLDTLSDSAEGDFEETENSML